MAAYDNFVGPSYQSQSAIADSELLVNWYVETLEAPGAHAKTALYPTPGVTELNEASYGPGRAHFAMAGREFAVIGTTLYEILFDGTLTDRGTVELDENPATISSNGDGGGQLFITSGANGYIYDLDLDTLSQVSALDGKASFGGMIDGYFLALDANTATFYISALLDGTSWTTGLDFAQRSRAPDPWLSMAVAGQYVWLFGEYTSEVWYNEGSASFPFAPHPSGFVHWGIAAPYSVAVVGSEVMWLSKTKEGALRLMRASGFQPQSMSDYASQTIIASYPVVSDAVAHTYSYLGHSFYEVTFPKADATWMWDAETRMWTLRGSWDSTTGEFGALRTRWHAFAFNEHRILDAVTGAVYRMGSDLNTDVDGTSIRRVRRAPVLGQENKRVFYSAFEVELEPGLGLSGGQGSDPQVMMRFSNDGGKTWSSERMRSAGKIGEYGGRIRWNRCGAGRRRVFEIAVTDPIPWRVIGASLELGQQPGMIPSLVATQPQQPQQQARR